MPKTAPSISLVIPSYNEEANVEETVRICMEKLGAFTDRYEIILIDDGSRDRTREITERLQRESAKVRVIRNPINLGVGISLLIGLKAARNDVVVHNAMDYPFDLSDLDKVLPLLQEHDVVVVARKDRSAHSPWRKLTSAVNFWLVRLLFGIRLNDMNFVQVYKRQVLEKVTVKAKSPAFVTPEMLIRARDEGFKICEIRAVFHRRKRGSANYGRPRDILWTLADMISFRLEKRKNAA